METGRGEPEREPARAPAGEQGGVEVVDPVDDGAVDAGDLVDAHESIAALPTRWARRPRGWHALALGLLALAFVASALFQAARDAPTVDEATDLSSGVTSLVRHDLRLEPEHPPLYKVLASVPALFAHPVIPDSPAYRSGNWFIYQDDFIKANVAAGRLRSFLFLARLVPILECLLVAWCLWLLATRLVSESAGTLAAALWLTTPVIVGLGHFALIDVPFTLTTLAFSVATLAFLERPTPRRALLLGISVGLGLAVRQEAIALLPLAMLEVAWVLRARRRDLLWAEALTTIAATGTLWAVYQAISPGLPTGWLSVAITKSPFERIAVVLPFPQQWRYGFTYLAATSGPRQTYLLGQSWNGSRWWFFPGSLLVKVPAVAIAVLLIGPWFARRLPTARQVRGLVAVVLPGLLLFGLMVAQPLNLGLRLVLPSLALWMVAASAIVLAVRQRWVQGLLVLLAVTQVLAFAVSTPHSLAWTPPPFRPGYRWTTDSNLDFGQDAFAANRWITRHPGVRVAEATARGMTIAPEGRHLLITDFPHLTGWVLIGASEITAREPAALSWVRAYCPVQVINETILIFRFDRPPDLRPGPAWPTGPCTGRRFSERR